MTALNELIGRLPVIKTIIAKREEKAAAKAQEESQRAIFRDSSPRGIRMSQ